MARWEAEREREHRHVGHSGVLGGGIHARSATWDNAVFLVTGIEAALQRDASAAAIPPDTLAQLAAEIEHQAPELMGPMPDAVASFLKRYRANAS